MSVCVCICLRERCVVSVSNAEWKPGSRGENKGRRLSGDCVRTSMFTCNKKKGEGVEGKKRPWFTGVGGDPKP